MGNHSSVLKHTSKTVLAPEASCKQQDKAKRESYNECEYWSAGLEVDESAECWDRCEKNPGHRTFIPVKDFGLEHLPLEWQNKDLVKLIKVYSDLTVRLRVPCGSGGKNRVGTGFVRKVDPTPGHCPCQQFKGQAGQRSWTFTISTAKHVIDDDSEFGLIGIDLFHDDVNSRGDGRMKTLKGGSVVETRDGYDWREFTCVCHDEDLAVQMMGQRRERKRLQYSLREWLSPLSSQPAIIVSHPHGRPKCVTVGEGRDFDTDSDMYRYSTDTCPGSSGALILGWWWWSGGPHHCQGGGEEGLNKGFNSLWHL